jgi:hypothetical protein
MFNFWRNMAMPELLENYLDRGSLARQLGVSERTIHRYENQPDGLPSLLIGGRRMYKLDSIRAWLERRERHPNPSRSRRAA